MKKKILTILIFGVIFLGITGCGKEKMTDTYELNIINDKIIEYFEKMVQSNMIIIVIIMLMKKMVL